jgi:hypothetical protein
MPSMNAIQTPRNIIIRGEIRLLVVVLFAFTVSWEVQAASLETVPATVSWCNVLEAPKHTSFFSVDTPGCSYPTIISAAKAYAIIWNADFKAKNMNVQVSINSCVNNGWSNQCYYYSYGANDPDPGPFPNNNNMNFIYVNGVWRCPDPTIDPSSPYWFNADTFNFVDASTAICVRVAKSSLTLTLSGGTSTEPGKSLPLTATVTDQANTPQNGVAVNISLKVDPTSGGHEHGDSTRPRGKLSSTACLSDATCLPITTKGSGVASFSFDAPEASGKHTITASCDKCSNTETTKIDVKVDGLTQIPASSYYALQDSQGIVIGSRTGWHTNNHNLTNSAAGQLEQLAKIYHQKFPNDPVLYLNDASLPWGGVYDIVHDLELAKALVCDLGSNLMLNIAEELLLTYVQMVLKDQFLQGMQITLQV